MIQISGKNVDEIMINGSYVDEIQMNGSVVYKKSSIYLARDTDCREKI